MVVRCDHWHFKWLFGILLVGVLGSVTTSAWAQVPGTPVPTPTIPPAPSVRAVPVEDKLEMMRARDLSPLDQPSPMQPLPLSPSVARFPPAQNAPLTPPLTQPTGVIANTPVWVTYPGTYSGCCPQAQPRYVTRYDQGASWTVQAPDAFRPFTPRPGGRVPTTELPAPPPPPYTVVGGIQDILVTYKMERNVYDQIEVVNGRFSSDKPLQLVSQGVNATPARIDIEIYIDLPGTADSILLLTAFEVKQQNGGVYTIDVPTLQKVARKYVETMNSIRLNWSVNDMLPQTSVSLRIPSADPEPLPTGVTLKSVLSIQPVFSNRL
jgi:hypothetical protein